VNRVKKRISKPIQDLKIRAEQEGQPKMIEGYFAKFNQETELFPGVIEKINPTAFKNIKGDIKALTDHDSRLVLGRTTSNTLILSVDDVGLRGTIIINDNDQDAVNLYARVQRGDVDQCSFGFIINDEEYEHRSDGTTVITLNDVDLKEVSVCTFPAYPQTSVSARKQDVEESKKRALDVKKSELKRRLACLEK
jgi:phage prohead protease, HK97 family